MSTENESANDIGGADETLRPSEALDSDEVRNDDGDEVVDPPDRWIEPKEDESLDERLSDEVPDVDADTPVTEAADDTGDVEYVGDDALDRVDPAVHGTEEGQISGAPEDGDSLFPIVE